MNKIYKKIKYNTGQTVSINVFLEEKFTLMGVFHSDTSSQTTPIFNTNTEQITGFTDSRLLEVKTYDKQQPYKLGVNGVTNIEYNSNGTYSKIYYTIDNIDYITDLKQNITQYSYYTTGFDSSNSDNYSVIKNDKYLGLDKEIETNNLINIERLEISVFDPHYRLIGLNNLSDIESYGGGNFFKIHSNQ